jgi:hypothetical protein
MSFAGLASISVSASSAENISMTAQHVRLWLLTLVNSNPLWLDMPRMHEWQKTDIKFLRGSNRTNRMLSGMVEPVQESDVLLTLKSVIPTIRNDVLDFFFADHIILFLCKYKHIQSSRSYWILSTQHVDGDTSVNRGGVDFGSLISDSGNDIRSNLFGKKFFSLAEGFSKVLGNRVHDLTSIYQ